MVGGIPPTAIVSTMHPRNLYRENPADFEELAEFRPSLRPFLIKKKGSSSEGCGVPPTSLQANPPPAKKTKFSYTLNFGDPDALRELTYAVLEKDFDLKLKIPSGRLIPAVPQKLNYIHWVEDLLACGQDAGSEIPKGKEIIGVDIGTGSSCIYPLLGTRLNDWSFLATDVSMDAVQCAEENVQVNNFNESIKVKLMSHDTILKEALDPSIGYSFTMCNPPFFASEEERAGDLAARSSLRPLPPTSCSGTSGETVTEGGEVEFVRKLVADSLEIRERVRWYTSMLGKKASVKMIMSELKSHQVPVVTTTEFVQGKTWRWGIAWSFDSTLENMMEVKSRKRLGSHSSLQLVIKGAEGSVPHLSVKGIHSVKEWLEEQLQDLKIDSTVQSCGDGCGSCDKVKGSCDHRKVEIRCTARRVTWTHQRQKKRLLEKLKLSRESSSVENAQGLQIKDSESESSPNESQRQIEEALSSPCYFEFTCSIACKISPSSSKRRKKVSLCCEEEEMYLEMKWIQGDGDKDQLHQIMQYLTNKMRLKVF